MWKRKGENKNNGQKSGQWFRVTTDARARERESTMFVRYLNASIRVFLSRGARSSPTLWIQLSPHLARQRRCGGRRSRGGRREEERNESKRIVWIAKMSAVWEAHRLIIIPNIISQQRWFHSFPSTFLPFFFSFFPLFSICIRLDRVSSSRSENNPLLLIPSEFHLKKMETFLRADSFLECSLRLKKLV